jgi:hypothetical protein
LEGRLDIQSRGGLVISINFPHLMDEKGSLAGHLVKNEAVSL